MRTLLQCVAARVRWWRWFLLKGPLRIDHTQANYQQLRDRWLSSEPGVQARRTEPRDAEDEVRYRMVELVALGALRTSLDWQCPKTASSLWRGEDLRLAPLLARCGGCNEDHEFSMDDVQVRFVPDHELFERRNA